MALSKLPSRRREIILICLSALVIRLLVGLHGYSGESNPPMYGDFEAQRHWMEITVNTPVDEWYTETEHNELSYWGLDYPPLTAYQSYLHGLFLRLFEPESVALSSSRGYETPSSKVLMRWTVILSDILILFPSAFLFAAAYYPPAQHEHYLWSAAMILLQPGLILIDHGHFQFNGISLGLSLAGIVAILEGREMVGSALFCLAINHKQMSLYYAPAFFGHLLGRCLQHRNPLLAIARLGLVVILTFLACWWPFISQPLQVLSRLAPLSRGIFEDYVANFWCTSSLVFKWKHHFPIPVLAKLSLCFTVLACLPSMVHQIRYPSRQGFILSMLSTSLSFYLFAFQVHEKSILLPLLPATLLLLEEPLLSKWLTVVGVFSMFPLIKKDNLTLPYVSLLGLFLLISTCWTASHMHQKQALEGKQWINPRSSWLKWMVAVSIGGCCFVHLFGLIVTPPPSLPFIHDALIVTYSFSHLVMFYLYTNWRLFTLGMEGLSQKLKSF